MDHRHKTIKFLEKIIIKDNFAILDQAMICLTEKKEVFI